MKKTLVAMLGAASAILLAKVPPITQLPAAGDIIQVTGRLLVVPD